MEPEVKLIGSVTSRELLEFVKSRSEPRADVRDAEGVVLETKVPVIDGEPLAKAISAIAALAEGEGRVAAMERHASCKPSGPPARPDERDGYH